MPLHKKIVKNDLNCKKHLQISHLEVFFDVYVQKMPSNMKNGHSLDSTNLDIL